MDLNERLADFLDFVGISKRDGSENQLCLTVSALTVAHERATHEASASNHPQRGSSSKFTNSHFLTAPNVIL